MRWFRFVLCAVACVLLLPAAAAEPLDRVQQYSTDPDTGLKAWHWQGGGISLELVQRLPDQSRGFFAARGFPPEAVERIARDCVFQTVIGNADPEGRPVQVDLARWRVQTPQGVQPPILEAQWDAQWQAAGIAEGPRIAFRWATFPTDQTFEDEDYNWGMTTMGLAPGTVFDLEVVWALAGERRSVHIAAAECAPDVERLVEEAR